MTRDSGHLASLLLEEGLLTQEALEKGLAMAAESGRPLGRVLVEEGIVSERDLVRTLAKAIGSTSSISTKSRSTRPLRA